MLDDLKNVDKVRALLSPTNVAIVGASDRVGSWGRKVWRALNRYNYAGEIFPVNPRNETVWDKPCYPSLLALPQKPDHVAILVPGAAAIEALREAAKAGARSATVFASGFGEGGDAAGRALGVALQAAVRESNLAVSGPNCMGNLAAPFGFATLPDDRIPDLPLGPVGLFGQSGGIVMAIFRALRSRGVVASYALTTGNEVGLTTADYIRYMVADDGVKVICCFIEAIRDAADFLAALDVARRARKPVVCMKIGGSEASRAAALAHTGSLAGSLTSFDAVTKPLGLLRVDTIDELVEVAEFLTHSHPPAGNRLGAITFSGGLKGLFLEAAERHDVSFPSLQPQTLARLKQQLGVGTSLGNPLDAGFAALSSADVYFKCIEIMLEDSNIDALCVQEELPLKEGQNAKAANLRTVDKMVIEASRKPVAVVSMASYMYTDYTREFRQGFPHLPVLHEVSKALNCLAHVARYGAQMQAPREVPHALTPLSEAELQLLAGATRAGDHATLNERQSKRLLAMNGVRSPAEAHADNAEAAVVAARDIGYPVVLKLVSDDIQHKSDVGGVRLNISSDDGVRAAFAAIAKNLAAAASGAHFGGVIVAPQISGGLELVLGVHRDPEVGPVVMFGAGGVLLELLKDVAFGPVPLGPAQARAMIASTRVSPLLDGYRGGAALDRDAVIAALVALSQLAARLGDRLESIDVNPLVALPPGKGAVALDGLVVLRAQT